MHATNESPRRLGIRAVLPIALALAAVPVTRGEVIVSLAVPGTSDPWLAGMPVGTSASCCGEVCDSVPAESPQLVIGLCLVQGDAIAFQASGEVVHFPGGDPFPPDGSETLTYHTTGAENGISDILAPKNSLLGVYLDDTQPDTTIAPPLLDFGTQESRDYATLTPLLKQVFFIGDGMTSGGMEQLVFVPDGASRLLLGTMDGCGWYNNEGHFDVTVTDFCENMGVLNDGALPQVPDARRTIVSLPSPFVSQASLTFRLDGTGPAHLSIFDASGRIISGPFVVFLSAGRGSMVWTGLDNTGKPVSPGIYFATAVSRVSTACGRIVYCR
jgi:hypothetical protein